MTIAFRGQTGCTSLATWIFHGWRIPKRWSLRDKLMIEFGVRIFGVEIIWEKSA
jgi:hypothetical protein